MPSGLIRGCAAKNSKEVSMCRNASDGPFAISFLFVLNSPRAANVQDEKESLV